MKHPETLKAFFSSISDHYTSRKSDFPRLPVCLYPNRGSVAFLHHRERDSYRILPVLNTRDKTYEVRAATQHFNVVPNDIDLTYRIRWYEFAGKLCIREEKVDYVNEISHFFALKTRFSYQGTASPSSNPLFWYDPPTGVFGMKFLPNGYAIRPRRGQRRRRYSGLYLLEVELFISFQQRRPEPLVRFGLPYRVFAGAAIDAQKSSAAWIDLTSSVDGLPPRRVGWGMTNVLGLSGILPPIRPDVVRAQPWASRSPPLPGLGHDDDGDVEMVEEENEDHRCMSDDDRDTNMMEDGGAQEERGRWALGGLVGGSQQAFPSHLRKTFLPAETPRIPYLFEEQSSEVCQWASSLSFVEDRDLLFPNGKLEFRCLGDEDDIENDDVLQQVTPWGVSHSLLGLPIGFPEEEEDLLGGEIPFEE